MRFIVLVASLSIAGCATATLSERNYGPPKSGTARYLNNGADFVIEQRRQDADKKIRQFCEGSYELKGEGEDTQIGGAVISHGMVTALSSSYVNMRFVCDEETPSR